MKTLKLVYQFFFDRWIWEVLSTQPHGFTYQQTLYRRTNRFTGKVEFIRQTK